MLLAKAGHKVTVLERDPDPPYDEAGDNWESWQRRGVTQFRLPHYFLACFRHVLETELPEVAKALEDAGALRYNVVAAVPEQLRGQWRPDDDRYAVLTARRPVAEAMLASVAERTPGVELRRGVAVTGLATGPSAHVGTPHVVGVVTADGEELRSDLVVDVSDRPVGPAPLARRHRRPAAGRGGRRLGFHVLQPAFPLRRRVGACRPGASAQPHRHHQHPRPGLGTSG